MTLKRLLENWQGQQQMITEQMARVFVRHAINNRGILTATWRGEGVAARLLNLYFRFLQDDTDEAHLKATATELAEQGLVFGTAGAMLRELTAVLTTMPSPEPLPVPLQTAVTQKTIHFQLAFLEQFALARELLQQRQQENAQLALQRALQHQLDQQRISHENQTRRNQNLNQILQLNARLTKIDQEETLISEAVQGICQALQLTDVSLYERQGTEQQWRCRASSTDLVPGSVPPTAVLDQLNAALQDQDDVIRLSWLEDNRQVISVATPLTVGKLLMGAMLVTTDRVQQIERDAFLIQIRTFAQNLAALWHNLYLFNQTSQRAKELEILHGRFIDRIWNEEETALQARFDAGQLIIDRQTGPQSTNSHETLPLQVGDQTFGHVTLPPESTLTAEDQTFIQTLVREMGDALNNAHLLQTTRAYSTQLSVATEVSRAATTFLNEEQLIRNVVELIRDRFDFYYVGLFMVDERRQAAVLKAGTGEAGRIQLENNHQHKIGGRSMIGAAVADGVPRVEQDVTQASAFMHNPLLPETRSELALPLRTKGKTIGALTVQSVHKFAFTNTAVSVLQSLADQLAIAIENATLFARLEVALAETNLLYEAGRQISTAADQQEIYRILVQFAGQSGIGDVVHLIVEDPVDPNYLIIPALWNRQDDLRQPAHRFLRDKYRFSEHLSEKETLVVKKHNANTLLDPYTYRLFQRLHISQATLIPLHHGDEWLGSLAVLAVESEPPTPQALQPLMTLADQAAVILANRQLLTQTETLYRIGRAINQAITRDDAVAIAVKEVATFTGASQCRLVLYDARQKVGRIAAASRDLTDAPAALPMQDDYLYEHLRRRREPLLLSANDQAAPAAAVEQHLRPFASEATLFIPAASQQDLIGFMAIDSARGKRPFKPSNVIFAQTVVDHLTTQIENLKLLDEALSRAQEMITLNQIQSRISGVLVLHELAQTIYEQVGRLLDNAIFILALYEAETAVYSPILVLHNGRVVETSPVTLPDTHPLYHFLQKGENQVTNAGSPLMQTNLLHFPPDIKPQAGLWTPLQQENNSVGLISVQSFDAHAYKDNDIQLLRSIAIHTNLAIANAKFLAEIQESNEKLRQLDQLKTQFLANMSHELRTPLNSIIGFSRVILKGIDGPITPDQEEDLTTIYNNGKHLLVLINEILDMAKIEAGKMTLAFESVDLIETSQAVGATIRSLLHEKNVRLIWDVPATLPPIEADPVRIRQILINLLSNAVKYTHQGSVCLTIKPEKSHVHILVADTGIGIAPEDYETVFAAFEQIDNSTTRSAGGTGLGLPITKWLVNMHDGEIWFESEVNQGTTFHVTLPYEQKTTAETAVTLSQSPFSSEKPAKRSEQP